MSWRRQDSAAPRYIIGFGLRDGGFSFGFLRCRLVLILRFQLGNNAWTSLKSGSGHQMLVRIGRPEGVTIRDTRIRFRIEPRHLIARQVNHIDERNVARRWAAIAAAARKQGEQCDYSRAAHCVSANQETHRCGAHAETASNNMSAKARIIS